MSFQLSANLEYLFHEAGDRIEDRIAAAAAAGLSGVELFMTAGRDIPSLRQALLDHDMQLVSTVADFSVQLVDPAEHARFCEVFDRAARDARELGCKNVVVTSGRGVPWLKRPAQLEILADAVRLLVPIAERHGVTILLESANTRVDHPGVLCSMTSDSVTVAELVGSPHVRLLYDLYHSVAEGENPEEVLPGIMHLIEHVQIADAPGRGEPGSGRIDWPDMIRLLQRLGYQGIIGVECNPVATPTAEALRYIQDVCKLDALTRQK